MSDISTSFDLEKVIVPVTDEVIKMPSDERDDLIWDFKNYFDSLGADKGSYLKEIPIFIPKKGAQDAHLSAHVQGGFTDEQLSFLTECSEQGFGYSLFPKDYKFLGEGALDKICTLKSSSPSNPDAGTGDGDQYDETIPANG